MTPRKMSRGRERKDERGESFSMRDYPPDDLRLVFKLLPTKMPKMSEDEF